jgi:hypothetical protein
MGERPIFKWRHFAPVIILCAARWYLRYSLSYREVRELFEERDLRVDHTTVWRWVQYYEPQLEERSRPHLCPLGGDLLRTQLSENRPPRSVQILDLPENRVGYRGRLAGHPAPCLQCCGVTMP